MHSYSFDRGTSFHESGSDPHVRKKVQQEQDALTLRFDDYLERVFSPCHVLEAQAGFFKPQPDGAQNQLRFVLIQGKFKYKLRALCYGFHHSNPWRKVNRAFNVCTFFLGLI